MGDTYTEDQTVTLPAHISGQSYVIGWADSYDAVLKSEFDVNTNPDDPNQLNNDNYKASPQPLQLLLAPFRPT